MRDRIRKNLPLYGHTRLSEYNQAVAFKNSYRSADKLCAFPSPILFSLFPFLHPRCSSSSGLLRKKTDFWHCRRFEPTPSRVHALVRPSPFSANATLNAYVLSCLN